MGVASKIKTTDKIVRAKLIENIYSDNKNLRVFEEFEVVRGKARADVVSVGSSGLHAYEIKSDVDTLNRLPSQTRHYNRVFSSVTLVVGKNHVVKSLYLIPEWWGVIVAYYAGEELRLTHIRKASTNTATEYETVSDLLRKRELIKILDEHSPGCTYSSMSKTRLIYEAKNRLTKKTFAGSLSAALLNRQKPTLLNSEVAF